MTSSQNLSEMNLLVALFVLTCCLWNVVAAFTGANIVRLEAGPLSHGKFQPSCRPSFLYATSDEQVEQKQGQEDDEERSKLDAFLEKKYKKFHQLINDEMMKAIKNGSVTVFVPNDAAFEALGEKKLQQLGDPRNKEIREKMGSYHILPEPISAVELQTEDWTKGRPKDGSKPSKYELG